MTIVNEYDWKLLETGMGELLRTPGFTANMRVVCTDDASLRSCQGTLMQPSHCVRSRETYGASDFKKNAYAKLVWLKWKVCLQALQWPGVSSVFFLDADVAVFAPFEEHLDIHGVDFMHALEMEDRPDSINGGQLWFKSNNRTLSYMREVLQHDGDAEAPFDDQRFAERALRAPLQWRGLPAQRFQSYCWIDRAAGNVTNLTLTYHANCCGTAADKTEKLRIARESWLQVKPRSPEGATKSPKVVPGSARLRAASFSGLGLLAVLPLRSAFQ